MSKQLGPLEVSCDAPSYNIVEACTQLGFRAPEDVRWLRMSSFLNEYQGAWGFLKLPGLSPREDHRCTCGQPVPRMDRFTFVLITGKEMSYFLGQCERCRTMFWEKG
jgi:hypothetical protein